MDNEVVKIYNKSKDSIIAENGKIAISFLSRLKGLMFKKELKKGEALIIKPCNSIHTFFMNFPIDVVFMNKNDKVVKVIERMKPYRISKIYFKANYVIELPVDTIKSSKTAEGDIIEIINFR